MQVFKCVCVCVYLFSCNKNPLVRYPTDLWLLLSAGICVVSPFHYSLTLSLSLSMFLMNHKLSLANTLCLYECVCVLLYKAHMCVCVNMCVVVVCVCICVNCFAVCLLTHTTDLPHTSLHFTTCDPLVNVCSPLCD